MTARGFVAFTVLAAAMAALGALSFGGCSPSAGGPSSIDRDAGHASAAASSPPAAGDADAASGDAEAEVEAAPSRAPIPPEHLVLAFREGRSRPFDARNAEAEGLTIVDLRDAWAPQVLRGTHDMPSTYEEVFVDLANERGEPVDHAEARAADYYLEVYGIPPSLSTIRRRYEREHSKACFCKTDTKALRDFRGLLAYRAESREALKKRARSFQTLERRVKRAMAEQGVESVDELEGESALVAQWKSRAPRALALRAAQKRLACEKLFPGRGRYLADAFDWATHIALLLFERRHRFYGWGYLDEETAEALAWTPEKTAWHTMKRTITERVLDAAGIIEDGSTWRNGKAPTYEGADGEEHEVRNLVAEFSEAAAEHLGLTSPEAAVEFLTTHEFEALRVALPLPELPEYYSDHMDLEVVIDRGDVWYDFPFDENDVEQPQPRANRPTLTLYTNYRGSKIPLIRYGTTIGGWRSTTRDGIEYWAYKNSDVGPRVWRRIIGAPSWIPPDSTPVRTLVTKLNKTRGNRWSLNASEIGPGYASAYGLVMGINELPVERDGETVYLDNGIRVHGSVNYQSIQKRHSHGCHRLYNHLALRLFDFVLDHRRHERVGQDVTNYRRTFRYDDQTFRIAVDTRGYEWRLTPPVPVVVTLGRILGEAQEPITEYIMKASERRRLAAEAAAAAQGDAGVAGDGGAAPAPAPAPQSDDG